MTFQHYVRKKNRNFQQFLLRMSPTKIIWPIVKEQCSDLMFVLNFVETAYIISHIAFVRKRKKYFFFGGADECCPRWNPACKAGAFADSLRPRFCGAPSGVRFRNILVGNETFCQLNYRCNCINGR